MEPYLGTYTCHDQGQNQFFAFAQYGHILTHKETSCLGPSDENNFVSIQRCNQTDDTQLWFYNHHVSSNLRCVYPINASVWFFRTILHLLLSC